MITVQVAWDDLVCTVSAEAQPHPDLLDELTTRCVRLFKESTAVTDTGDETGE